MYKLRTIFDLNWTEPNWTERIEWPSFYTWKNFDNVLDTRFIRTFLNILIAIAFSIFEKEKKVQRNTHTIPRALLYCLKFEIWHFSSFEKSPRARNNFFIDCQYKLTPICHMPYCHFNVEHLNSCQQKNGRHGKIVR